MWNVNPELMCRKHLLGEHVEMHMFSAALNSGKKLDGYINTGLLEVHNIKLRHDDLAQEMIKRGYRHDSPIADPPHLERAGFVNIEKSYEELQARCLECRKRIQKIK